MKTREFQGMRLSSNGSLFRECLLQQNASAKCLGMSFPAVGEGFYRLPRV